MRINIYGFLGATYGWATHCRNFAQALARNHEVRIIPLDEQPPAESPVPLGQADPSADVALCIGPRTITRQIQGRCKIIFFTGETTRIPAKVIQALLDADEIWVPSRWGRDVLVANGIAGETVHVVPEGVDPHLFTPAKSRPEGPFRFLFVGKWEKRKGVMGLLRCFRSAFSPDEDVELVLRSNVYHPRGLTIEKAVADLGLGRTAPIRFIEPLTEAGLAELYRASDAFVLPTRGEGWGLPVLEAMASGLPAIVTAFSAPLDFLDRSNSFPARVQAMVPVRDPIYFGGGNDWGEWAEPDWVHLASTMRQVFENREEGRRRGAKAREDVVSRWTWDHAAKVAETRLAALSPA
ncbi:MAG: glycosyltransferase [Novosphingobium sp.]|nr:glycosyltransferase [Novosphingobium sp.]MCP5404401.1 glycosyltransferase [Novosphingobium sp.]